MSVQVEIQKVVEKINQAYKAGQFLNYISYIRFPYYKNLEVNTRIDFNFPFTVFTGQNGSGKSSTLHAIQGAPSGESPTKFWFSTDVDPIVEGDGNRNCFIYGYFDKSQNKILEVLKTRIADNKYQKELDLWETARPRVDLGMEKLSQGKRNKPLEKNVKYLDFRSELSAFDKYFYFTDLVRTKTISSKQDYIRKYSSKLKQTIENGTVHFLRNKKKNEIPTIVSKEALEIIGRILGKKYLECKLIKHSLFKTDGTTVFFKTDSINYSEAFAGRGEFAVVRLVCEVLDMPNYSLIVLDEPEVSLHPGAQEQLKLFLLNETLKKKLQVIISSHSPKLVSYLPESAIKLFYQSSSSNKFLVKNQTHYIEAFDFIGQETSNTGRIYVEDKLAKEIIDGVIKTLDKQYSLLFEVIYYQGGSKEILKSAVKYSEEDEMNKFMILDGDEKKNKVDPLTLTVSDSQNFEKLDGCLKSTTGIEFKNLGFRIDSLNSSGNEHQKIEAIKKFMSFIYSNLQYLPSESNPESLIWDIDYANRLLETSNIDFRDFDSDHKTNFHRFTELFFEMATDSQVSDSKKLFVNNFCKKKNENYKLIVQILEDFKNKIEALNRAK